MLLAIIPPLLIVVAFLGLLLSTRFSRTKAIICTSVTALVVLLGAFSAHFTIIRIGWRLPVTHIFTIPWILVLLCVVVLNLAIVIREREPLAPEIKQGVIRKANKWFLVALVAILVAGVPLYWDWNMGTSHRGYSFNRVNTGSSFYLYGGGELFVSFRPFTALNAYQITNNQHQSPFEGEIITFIGRNQIHFSGRFYDYYVRNPRFGIWHDIRITGEIDCRWDVENLTRHNDRRWVEWYLAYILPEYSSSWQYEWDEQWYERYMEYFFEADQRAYIIFSAIKNAELVQSVGFIDNFFRVIRIPTLALLAIYTMFRIGLRVKPGNDQN
ncbi:MAG: hypothetical protein FWE21_08625 [Defluviitaleaceae bacterium]|nr:hypothetical protein [Defluviitaleaceae bacterium]